MSHPHEYVVLTSKLFTVTLQRIERVEIIFVDTDGRAFALLGNFEVTNYPMIPERRFRKRMHADGFQFVSLSLPKRFQMSSRTISHFESSFESIRESPRLIKSQFHKIRLYLLIDGMNVVAHIPVEWRPGNLLDRCVRGYMNSSELK